MSPRASSAAHRSTSSAAAPYPRRASGQPKSTRQQFSACGACRMRSPPIPRDVNRVRCDLKDLAPVTTSDGVQQPSCSNCKERNIKCVHVLRDEFAEVKAVKLLRRGRRLQQVEAVYGKVTDTPTPSPTQHASTPTAAPSTPNQSIIPQLKIEFLSSTFFRRFCAQRPVIEPTEFTARYFEHVKGSTLLSVEGQMLAMLLVTWATSFGINEYGVEMEMSDLTPTSPTSPKFTPDSDGELSEPKRVWALRTEAMTREIIALVDTHGILRRPSWDGVRVMLLLLPLTKGIQSSIERRTTYEATLSQVYALCNLTSPSSVNSGRGPFGDALVRARIFWYAYIHESITTGLRGGRLLLDEDDLHLFQNTLPPQYSASSSASSPSSAPESSVSSSASSSPVNAEFPSYDPRSHTRIPLTFMLVKQYFSLALSVSGVCRAIHTHLTGPRALQCAEAGISVAHEAMMNIWDSLTHCWEDFEAFRHDAGSTIGGGLIRGEDVERIVSGWQVFIFECLNVIRDALKHRVELQVRPHLPPLSMSFPRVESGPDTALTDDGAGSWSAYTPPTTSGSATSTIATQRSSSPASPPPTLSSAKHPLKTEDTSYGVPELDQFSFSVDGAATGPNLIGPGLGSPHTWAYPHHQHLDPTMIYSGTDAVLGRIGEDGCPHFGSDCQAFYHQ
ncbi:hypothetical protein PISMIDRAFT_23012 [Pisolithus microcarpus 441]|uniref:Transcription factor domain-containing protein n=1 Tax=Pisolithus microcarpus 441 TaxID=765257 RepID=A0A0C9ZG59_9AGAM|nr:hypothetical protein PISMIDRAFT_23012 [Pisolithus microcarpus 441]